MAVADAIEAGFKQVLPDATYVKLPMADGGEGTVQSLVDATGGRILPFYVTAPLGNKVQGFVGLLGMASARSSRWRRPLACIWWRLSCAIRCTPRAAAPAS